MRLAVFFRFVRFATSKNHSFPTFVEDLSDAGIDVLLIPAVIKADPNKTRGVFRRRSCKSPRSAARFVIERRMEVPCSCGGILNASDEPVPSHLFRILV